jgi:hypothetical protein
MKSSAEKGLRGAVQKFSGKIQSIYNGKSAPITMQGFAQASENLPAQEQWQTMKKQCAEQSETVRNQGECLRPDRDGAQSKTTGRPVPAPGGSDPSRCRR